MKRHIFVQSELLSEVTLLEVNSDTKPKELRELLLKLMPKDVCDHVGIYIEDNDDEDALECLTEIAEGTRFHLHRLKSIDVTVHYAGREVTRTFRPSATIARVKKWSARELGISASDAAEMALQISGTDERPDLDIHIGTLVVFPCKSLAFDLVPSPRVNGGDGV